MYRDHSYSYAPSYSFSNVTDVVTLPVAFQIIVDGRVDAMNVFRQSPKQLQAIIDEAYRASLGKDFKDLRNDERKGVFSMFLLALQNLEKNTEPTGSKSAPPNPSPNVRRVSEPGSGQTSRSNSIPSQRKR